MSTHLNGKEPKTFIWRDSDESLTLLADRTTSLVKGVVTGGGSVDHIEMTPAVVEPRMVLYSALVVYRERYMVPAIA